MESILSNTTISKIIEGKKSKIARVDTETTVEKLVGTLTSHGILSVPVWDEVEKNYKYFVGMKWSDIILTEIRYFGCSKLYYSWRCYWCPN